LQKFNLMNILEKLIIENSENKNQFAKMVGETPQTINAQIKSKNPLLPAYKYAKILGKKELKGIANGCEIHLIFE
jgi:DNA-binding XRE family transcriptional regulator